MALRSTRDNSWVKVPKLHGVTIEERVGYPITGNKIVHGAMREILGRGGDGFAETHKWILLGISSLFNLPWFSRAWIFQEVVLSAAVPAEFWFGFRHMSLSKLVVVGTAYLSASRRVRPSEGLNDLASEGEGSRILMARFFTFEPSPEAMDRFLVRFWIDALSINQQDTPERTEQVGRMGNVYKSAASLLVWGGSHQRPSSLSDHLSELAFGCPREANQWRYFTTVVRLGGLNSRLLILTNMVRGSRFGGGIHTTTGREAFAGRKRRRDGRDSRGDRRGRCYVKSQGFDAVLGEFQQLGRIPCGGENMVSSVVELNGQGCTHPPRGATRNQNVKLVGSKHGSSLTVRSSWGSG
jgi:hypothetical protein